MEKRVLGLALAFAAAIGGTALALRFEAPATAQEDERAAAASVPVTAAKAQARDMPVYIRGIGTVQAYNAVNVKSRVDGQIVKVDFTEGQEVKAGDLLYEIDSRPFQAALAQANAVKAKDEAQLASATADLKRDDALLAHNFQTRQAYDQQKAVVGQLQAAIAGDNAQIEMAKLNLSYTQIRAPIAGRLGARLVDAGNLVHAAQDTTLVTIEQLRPIFVTFTEPQRNFEAIRASAAEAPISAEALNADGTKGLASGKVSLIDNQIDQASGTIRLKAEFANTQETLWPGEFVNMRLRIATLKDAITAPARAVQQGPDGPYLFVVRNDMTVESRAVTVAETEDGLAVITKGLAAGETVVVDGQYRLDQGTRVSLERQAASGG